MLRHAPEMVTDQLLTNVTVPRSGAKKSIKCKEPEGSAAGNPLFHRINFFRTA
jgi:hypothetical protein